MLNQAHVRHWTDPRRAASRPKRDDDEIDAIFAEIRTVAVDFPFREQITAEDKALSLEGRAPSDGVAQWEQAARDARFC